jgi:hypothetical protein
MRDFGRDRYGIPWGRVDPLDTRSWYDIPKDERRWRLPNFEQSEEIEHHG